MGPYGPAWARMGPARALDEREKFWKNAPAFVSNACLSKIVVFNLHITFFDSFTCSSDFWPKSATVPCGHQWSVYDVLGWFCGPGPGSGSGTGFLSLKGSQGVALNSLIFPRVIFFHVFFVTHFPTL